MHKLDWDLPHYYLATYACTIIIIIRALNAVYLDLLLNRSKMEVFLSGDMFEGAAPWIIELQLLTSGHFRFSEEALVFSYMYTKATLI